MPEESNHTFAVGTRVRHQTGWTGVVTRRIGKTGICVQPDGNFGVALYSPLAFTAGFWKAVVPLTETEGY